MLDLICLWVHHPKGWPAWHGNSSIKMHWAGPPCWEPWTWNKRSKVKEVSSRITLPVPHLRHPWQRAGIGTPVAMLVVSWPDMQIQWTERWQGWYRSRVETGLFLLPAQHAGGPSAWRAGAGEKFFKCLNLSHLPCSSSGKGSSWSLQQGRWEDWI